MAQSKLVDNENFLHKTTNVTAWMREGIEKFIAEKGYAIVLFDIDSEIMTRLGKITIINTFTLKMKDKSGNIISVDNYSSINKEYDDLSLKWLIDFVKEREMEAILKFGGKALGTESESARSNKQVEFKVQGEKRYGSLMLEIYFSSNIQDMIKFIAEPQFHVFWMGPTMKNDGGSISFENVVLRNIQSSSDSVSLEYKWRDWPEYSQVFMEFVQVGDNLKINLNQKHVPVEFVDNVKNHWNSRIFMAISSSFGCAIKPT
ncbi:uncharacterized protein VICG_01699 [Vittaforma corneae ATCC 50505]|uniref:Activator of Hsp90 ATPase N-terminal domain-containing protein n=1 Tax=Vittaforma corneae (strain ATCC 50505) TaxID=993615 RepID=L2GL39_VITCO|nr:uncharacterized protein VICG_01699 [Vittaforma corneae ATCC 50505]ELA41210.1 hypothetical protein VICG_01699 [Vittaforma corneae ATCC 50505]